MKKQYESSWNDNTSNPLRYAKKIYLNGKEVNSLRIPSGVKKIGSWAFLGCARFDEVAIPASVESIGMYAFCDCVDLADISFAKNSRIDSIANGAFYGCNGLTEVSLPQNLKYLGPRCFYKCNNLQTIVIPNGVKEIPANAFYQCKSLHNVNLPEGMEAIGSYAFYGCSALEKIDIPSTLNYIGPEAFDNCNSLQGVYITDLAAWCKIGMPGQERGGGWAETYNKNNPLFFAHNLYLNNELVTDLVIPEGVEAIEALTFAKATCLKSVTIPEGCKRIGGGAFYACPNIETIRIPASMETFETVYFYDGTSISPGPFSSQLQTDVKLYIEDLETWINNLGSKFRLWDNKSRYHVSLYVHGKQVKDLIIPESITKMDEAFYDFDFNSVTLPAGMESITDYAFRYCTKIK